LTTLLQGKKGELRKEYLRRKEKKWRENTALLLKYLYWFYQRNAKGRRTLRVLSHGASLRSRRQPFHQK